MKTVTRHLCRQSKMRHTPITDHWSLITGHWTLVTGHRPLITGHLILITALLLLASCAPAAPTADSAATVAPALSTPEPLQAWTATVPPLRFVLPTPGAAPVSGWRPPLYPVPWAVSSYDHFYFTRPNAADQVNWPLPSYRYGQMFFANVVHTGIDIDAEEGTPVLAAGGGVVVWAGWGLFSESPLNEDDPYGQAVAIRHDFGYGGQQLFTAYAHMSRVDVTLGQHVETGEQVGLVGQTGNVTGPHLHFEVRLGENSFHHTYNPELWLAPPEGWGVLVARLEDKKRALLQLFSVLVTEEATGITREVRTYGGGAVNSDPYYQENLVLSDLAAGLYRVTLEYEGDDFQFWLDIYPGQISYFTFSPRDGFIVATPPVPELEFLPYTLTPGTVK